MTLGEALLNSVTIDGEPVSGLYDQWSPAEHVVLADNVQCLTFHDPLSGRSAVWYLDGNACYCGSHIEVVQRLRPEEICDTVAPWFDDLARHALVSSPTPLPDIPPMPLFLAVQLAAAWAVRNLADVRLIQSALLGKDRSADRPEDLPIAPRQLHRLLGTRIAPETLVVLSPFTDRPLRSQISFSVDHQIIHRFCDPETDTVFYLVWWEKQLDQSPSLYFPESRLIVSDIDLAGMIPPRILGWYMSTPDHVSLIAEAREFEAQDFGLGSASSLLASPENTASPPTTPEDVSTADMISESWAFLHRTQDEPSESPAAEDSTRTRPSGSLLGRLRSLVRKR